MGLALIVHGGAGTIPAERYDAAKDGCSRAARAGWQVLARGGSAVEAVEAAVVVLENDPGFNAGTGAVLTIDGRAQLDAGIMDGATLDVGAIAGVERVKNPVRLAQAVLRSPHVLLMGTGAEQFAAEAGMALVDPSELVTSTQHARWLRGYRDDEDVHVGPDRVDVGAVTMTSDLPDDPDAQPAKDVLGAIHADDTKHGTVGAVAVDATGTVAAATSTGGIAAKHPGRIGDTPIVGAGFYAENGIGGVSSTGHGEDFIRLLLARRAAEYLANGLSAQEAAAAAIRMLGERVSGSGGLILLDSDGNVGFAHNTPSMAYAFMRAGMAEPEAGV